MAQNDQREDLTWEALEHQDWHLWLLAILLMFVLGVSLLSFMFPAAFWFRDDAAVEAPDRAFFGFSILLALVLVYMLQRQATVRRLKRRLFEAQAAVVAAKRDTVVEIFKTLPRTDQFRDMLAMEYRRASTSNHPLAGAVFIAHKASPEALGNMAYLLRSVLRQGESLYRISNSALGIILPGMQLSGVAALAAKVEELSGIPKEEFGVTIAAYPDEANSLAEMEQRLRGHILPE